MIPLFETETSLLVKHLTSFLSSTLHESPPKLPFQDIGPKPQHPPCFEVHTNRPQWLQTPTPTSDQRRTHSALRNMSRLHDGTLALAAVMASTRELQASFSPSKIQTIVIILDIRTSDYVSR